jgi:hypothetical protein
MQQCGDQDMDSVRTLIKQSVQGTVYYIDSPTGKVYTYSEKADHEPTYIGQLEKLGESEKHLISKTNGCLSDARVRYRSDVKDVMLRLRAATHS